MHVTSLELVNFRSYASLEIELGLGPTAFIGSNGQGKTNVVEAIDYLATLGSHRVTGDAALVRVGFDQAVIRARLERDGRQALVEVEITPGKSNRARLNRNGLPRARDILGVARTVIFSPEDLALIKGDPSGRRAFLDTLLTQRTPRLAGVRSDYDRVLKQRNSLLKSTAGGRRQVDLSTLDIRDEQLARLAGEIIARRLELLGELSSHLIAAYKAVAESAADDRRNVTASYRPSFEIAEGETEAGEIAERLLAALAEGRRAELERGLTLVGPHRDDVLFAIGEFPAKGFASHGETWSLALALKLASFDLLRSDGDDPVLILDDVFAELDTSRRALLADVVSSAEQVLITAAVAADVPESLMAQRFDVHEGRVERVES